jgi:hypothetical protein
MRVKGGGARFSSSAKRTFASWIGPFSIGAMEQVRQRLIQLWTCVLIADSIKTPQGVRQPQEGIPATSMGRSANPPCC